MSDSGRVQASKWSPFTTLCVDVCRGHQSEIERIRPPPTNSKNRLKSFCEVGYVSVFQPFCCSGTFSKCCIAHGTLCSCDTVVHCCNRVELWLRISSQAISVCFGGTPGSHSRNPVFPRNPGWKTLGCANFRPNVFSASKRISVEILVEVKLHAWCPVALKIFVAFSKNGNLQDKYLSSL